VTSARSVTALRELMEQVERILEALEDGDVLMAQVFTEELQRDLQAEHLLRRAGLQ
jgi:hypothetical protein